MLALLHAMQPRTNVITGTAKRRIVGEKPATLFKLQDVAFGLGFAPGTKGVEADVV